MKNKTEYRVVKGFDYAHAIVCYDVEKKHKSWLFGDKWKLEKTKHNALKFTDKQEAIDVCDRLIEWGEEVYPNEK